MIQYVTSNYCCIIRRANKIDQEESRAFMIICPSHPRYVNKRATSVMSRQASMQANTSARWTADTTTREGGRFTQHKLRPTTATTTAIIPLTAIIPHNHKRGINVKQELIHKIHAHATTCTNCTCMHVPQHAPTVIM